MFGWTTAHIPLLISLPILLLASGFFSGSETALFGLSHSERFSIRRMQSIPARAVQLLLSEPRMLLITILLGNMVVNVLYFVISSVLLLNADEASLTMHVLLGVTSLLLIVVFGEVLPKMIANSTRLRVTLLVGPPLAGLHQLILPVRRFLDLAVVTPLSRLTAPPTPPPGLDRRELTSLLELSTHEGIISDDEQRVLADVVNLGARRVRNVMTPRVKMASVQLGETKSSVAEVVRATRLTKLPVTDGNLDRIVGILHVKRFLLDDGSAVVRESDALTKARFIPELATLDRLLDDFQRTHTQIAIAVDEYGGTAGIIAIEDIVREIVGELRDFQTPDEQSIEQVDSLRWRVAGDVDIRDLEYAILGEVRTEGAATVGGAIARSLGRSPEVGDVVPLGNMVVEVESISGTRLDRVLVTYFRSFPDASLEVSVDDEVGDEDDDARDSNQREET